MSLPISKAQLADDDKNGANNLFQLFCIGILLILFSYFTNVNRFIALLLLLASQVLIIHSLKSYSQKDLLSVFGIRRGKKIVAWLVVCAGSGILLAGLYRNLLAEAFFPSVFYFFSLPAILIGGMEEIIFRGYFYYRLERYPVLVRLFFCPLIHTLYKVALFVPFQETNFLFLFRYTFFLGILLTYIRFRSKSIYACLLFHCLFDLLVYGDAISSPWWVW